MLSEGILGTYQRVFIKCGETDLRCGIPSLTAMLMFLYGVSTFEVGTLYLFCNASRKKVKGLMKAEKGFVLLNIALETDKIAWITSSNELIEITGEELEMLFQGKNIQR